MSLKKLTNITPAELKSKGVVSLADKPNAAASYGVGGLSPTALKLWFDQLSKLLADKINAIQDALSGDQAAEYIKLILTGLDDSNESGEYSLQDLCDAFKNGNFAEYLQAYGSAAAENLSSLQTIINTFALDISTAKETAEDAKDAAETAENNRIIETAVEYQEGTSGTSAPTGAWSSAIPAVQEGRYLWTRVTLTFASGSTAVFYSVGKIAARGDVNLEVGTVTTETIDAGLDADFDVSVRHEEGTNKVLLDFDAKIPRGESGTDDEAVHFTPQTLTEPQQTQAQQNMGIGLSYEQLEDGTYNLVIRLTGDVPSNAAITQINGEEIKLGGGQS